MTGFCCKLSINQILVISSAINTYHMLKTTNIALTLSGDFTPKPNSHITTFLTIFKISCNFRNK